MDEIEKRVRKINILISKNLLNFRVARRLSRKDISSYLGITEQQLMKYEKGTDRIPIARLILFVEAFYKDIVHYLFVRER